MVWRSRARCPRGGAGRRNTVSLRPRVQGLIPDQYCQKAKISVAELEKGLIKNSSDGQTWSRIVCWMNINEKLKGRNFFSVITKAVCTSCRIYCDIFNIDIDITVLRFLLPNAVIKKFKFSSGRIFFDGWNAGKSWQDSALPSDAIMIQIERISHSPFGVVVTCGFGGPATRRYCKMGF